MDVDKDGILDIVSGCYSIWGGKGGRIQWLKGKGGLQFESPRELLTEAAKPLLFRKKVEGASKLNIATHAHVADLNDDGLPDIVIGSYHGYFHVFEGVKAAKELSFSDEPYLLRYQDEGLVHVKSMASPYLVDWDRDGDLDIVSGSGSGAVYFIENVGDKEKPIWKQASELLPYAGKGAASQWAHEPFARGSNARLFVTDYNGDGFFDLLVGDHKNILTLKPGVSVQDHKDRRLLARHYEDLAKRISSDEAISAKQREVTTKNVEKYIDDLKGDYWTSSYQGDVWVFIQKPTKPTQ